jgi:ferric-dicitrate binding protein FerR (iron transport regulator)
VEKKDIESLLIKSFTGKADKGEEQAIREWVTASEENKTAFNAYKKLWDESKALALSGAIDLEPALRHTKHQIPQFNKKTRWLGYWRQAVAVLLLSVLLSSAYNFLLKPNQNVAEQTIYQEIKAAYGTQTQLQLADGTTVWLNAGSKLSFPISFKNLEERKVSLAGEGFFEVTKNTKHPFIVHTPQMDIKVLGTSFNVNAYENEDQITVALEEGKVSLLKHTNGKTKEMISLSPNEVASYDLVNNQIMHKTEKDLGRYSAWKDGLIVFFDDPLEKVVARLENWYNVKIEVPDKKLLKTHITGTFNDNSLDQVLYFLSLMSPIEYQFKPEKEGTKQTIILKSKTK